MMTRNLSVALSIAALSLASLTAGCAKVVVDHIRDGEDDGSNCVGEPSCPPSCAAAQAYSDTAIYSTADGPNALSSSCARASGREVVVEFSSGSPERDFISIYAPPGEGTFGFNAAVSVRERCDDPASELDCMLVDALSTAYGYSIDLLEPGRRYFLIIDGVAPNDVGAVDLDIFE